MTHPSLIKYYKSEIETVGNRTVPSLIYSIIVGGVVVYALAQIIF